MNEIEELRMSLLSTNELSKTGESLVSITKPLHGDVYVDRQNTKITESVDILTTIPSTPQGSDLTESINGVDNEIDRLLPLLENTLKANVEQYAFFQEKAQASSQLLKVFGLCDRKKLLYGGYADQGAEIAKLFKHILTDELATIRETSGTAPIWMALEKWNEKLKELLELRLNEGKLPTTTKDQRRKLKFRINNLLTYLNANIVDGVEGFDVVQTPVNELITDVMSAVRARKTRKSNQEAVSE